MSIEAMKQALKALELVLEVAEKPKHEVNEAITALRQAIAEAEKQPKREWIGLTDEEIDQGQKESWVTKQAWESAVWWAEAKLKEKNT